MSAFKFIVDSIELNTIKKRGSDFDGHTQVVFFLTTTNLKDTKRYRQSIVLAPEQTNQIEMFEKMASTGDFKLLQQTVDSLKYEVVEVQLPKYYLLDKKTKEIRTREDGSPMIASSMKVLIETYTCKNDDMIIATATKEANAIVNRTCKWVEEVAPSKTNGQSSDDE
jgi:hypothetical protein